MPSIGIDINTLIDDRVAVNADAIQVASNAAQVAANLLLTDADQQATAADRAQVSIDSAQVALDRIATNQDTIDTAADVVLTHADVAITNADVVEATTQAGVSTTKATEASASAAAALLSENNAKTAESSIAASSAQIQTNLDSITAILLGSDTLLDTFVEVETELALKAVATDVYTKAEAALLYEPIDSTIIKDGDFITAGLMKTDGAGGYSIDSNTYLTSETAYPADALLAEDITNIGNLSGTNTGDQDLSSYNIHIALTNAHIDWTAEGAGTIHSTNYTNTTYSEATPGTDGTDGVDGLLTDSDKFKLDNIEDSATADQTDAEIKTAYENNADTNALTDARAAIVDNVTSGLAGKVDDSQVLTNVPIGAVFTDTTYTDEDVRTKLENNIEEV